MTDEVFNTKISQLGAWLSNMHLLCDTMQREVLYDSLEKATKDIKEGRNIDLSKFYITV